MAASWGSEAGRDLPSRGDDAWGMGSTSLPGATAGPIAAIAYLKGWQMTMTARMLGRKRFRNAPL